MYAATTVTGTQPWHFYVILGLALALACGWALHRLRYEAEARTEWCGWCRCFGCRCTRRDKRRRRPR
jgi:hypothetical protein